MIFNKQTIGLLLLTVFFSVSILGCRKNESLINTKAEPIHWSLPIILNSSTASISDPVNLTEFLKDPKVDYILLYFWATWNESDNAELLYLESLYQTYKDKGLLILGISIDTAKDYELVVKKIKKSVTYPVLWDERNEAKKQYGISTVPYRIILNKNNDILFKSGVYSEDQLKKLTAKIKELMP